VTASFLFELYIGNLNLWTLTMDNIFLKLKRLRLQLSEYIIPKGYYIQSEPIFLSTENDFIVSEYPVETISFNRSLYGNRYAPMRDTNRWLLLRLLLNRVSSLGGGDYAELGTYQGASARIIYKHMDPSYELHCFDTFSGFDPRDIVAERETSGILASEKDFADSDIASVEKFIRELDLSKTLRLHKGYFPETFSGLESKEWRFVHLDCDLYEPIRTGLENFWPKLVNHGVMVIHDYNSAYIGVKKAVDEFCQRNLVAPIPYTDKSGSVILVKQE